MEWVGENVNTTFVPKKALLKLQWRIYAFSCVLVAFHLAWTVVEMPVIVKGFVGGEAGKR
jgi:hypothetical protein